MKPANFKLHLRGKLILLVVLIIALIITAYSVVSYITVEKAYESAIASANESFDTKIRTAVENIISVLQVNYDRYKSGEITEQEALENAKNIIRNSRYGEDGEGYFWADMENGICAAHMNPEYEGLQRMDYKDPQGNYYVRDFISVGNNPEGGFTEFYFVKPGEDVPTLKRSYTKKFEPYGWYISTGNYMDDVNALLEKYSSQKATAMLELVLSGTLATIIGIVVLSFAASAITKPLNAVTERIKLLSEGDLHTPVPKINNQDETGMLALSTGKTIDYLRGIIENITLHLDEMSGGDFSSKIEGNYVGDMEPIKNSMEKISDSLNYTLSHIQQSSQQVSAGAGQVSSAAQNLAQGTLEQSSAVEVLTNTMTQIQEHVKHNSSNAETASRIARKTAEETQKSNQQMTSLMNAMSDINFASNEIGKIIKTIDDLAFQTNVLALNAAVEAARAGTAGKGFAVVADEVRNLATKSAEAAASTTEMINNTLEAVQKGSEIAGETSKSLQLIVESTKKSADLVKEISEASERQSDSIGEATEGVEQISAVIQNNSATAEETAATSEELSGQVQMMDQLIGQFKLKKEYMPAN